MMNCVLLQTTLYEMSPTKSAKALPSHSSAFFWKLLKNVIACKIGSKYLKICHSLKEALWFG